MFEAAGAHARRLVSRGERAEAAGLAALQRGELEAADAAFASLEASAADGAAVGRALGWRGCVAHRRGLLGVASDRYREASQWLADAGDRAGAASAALSLASILVERGRISEALPRLAAVGQALAGERDRGDRCRAALCATTALLLAGRLDDAHASAADALAASQEAPALRARALIGDGEVRRRLGDEPGALRRFHEALALAASRDDAVGQLRAQLALAEAGQATDELPRDDDRAILARGRRALVDPASVRGASPSEAVRALAVRCGEVAVRAADGDRLERAFRGHALAAQLAHRAGDAALAHGEAVRARVAHAAFAAVNAAALRPALDGDPDLARVVALATRAPIVDVPEPVAIARAAITALPALATAPATVAAPAEPTPIAPASFDAQLTALLAALPSSPDASLALRPVLAAVEQAFVAAAMARANDNQTAAARLLGLSRFGLQKKLRRLAEAEPDVESDDA